MDLKPAPTRPAIDVIAPPVEPLAETETAGLDIGPKPAIGKPAKPTATKPDGPPNPNVSAAIIATVIIVLGLAVLATFAYIKTSGS